MPADLDELLARAAVGEAQKDELSTRAEVMAELEEALDELETRWPNGEPGGDDSLEGLEYLAAKITADVRLGALRNGHYRPDSKPALKALPGGAAHAG